MAKEIYVGIDSEVITEEAEFTEFTSNPAPTTWTDSSDYLSATATNDYGEWRAEANMVSSTYPISYAFDESTGTAWSTGAVTSSSTFVWCAVYLPTGLSINPASIDVTYGHFANASVQGLNETTGNWEDITTLGSTSKNIYSTTLSPTVIDYYTAFRVYGTHYSSGYNQPRVGDFQITSGTLKTTTQSTVQKSVARKVKKAYIGVDSKARKVKKGYIGVNGIAQKFYENLTLTQTTVSTATIQLNSISDGAKTLKGYITGVSDVYKPTVTWTTTAPDGFYLSRYESRVEGIGFNIFVNGSSKTSSLSTINTRLRSTTYDSDTYMEIGGTSGCSSGTLYRAIITIDFGKARSFTINAKSPTGTGNTGDLTCYVSSDNSTWSTLSAGSKATNKRYCKIELTNLEYDEAYPWSYFYFSNITDWVYQ